MEIKQFYREIVNEHNLHPMHKGRMEGPDLVLRGVNPSCGDDIILQLKLNGEKCTPKYKLSVISKGKAVTENP